MPARAASPTVNEIAQYLEIAEEEVLDGLQTAEAYDAISLDAPLQSDDDGAISRLDAIGDDDERLVPRRRSGDDLRGRPASARRERQILFLRFGEDLTQTEIAERIGVSQMQVSRLLRKSLSAAARADRRTPLIKRRRRPADFARTTAGQFIDLWMLRRADHARPEAVTTGRTTGDVPHPTRSALR